MTVIALKNICVEGKTFKKGDTLTIKGVNWGEDKSFYYYFGENSKINVRDTKPRSSKV